MMRGGHRGRGGSVFGSSPAYKNPTFNPRPYPYDLTMDILNSAAGSFKLDNATLNQEIISRASSISLADSDRILLSELQKRVIEILEKEKETSSVPDVKIDEIFPVGSFAKNVSLANNTVSDVTVILSTLPTPENVAALGMKLTELLKTGRPQEAVSMAVSDFGVQITTRKSSIRILVTTQPDNACMLEPGLHMPEKEMMLNYFAVKHARWFLQAAGAHAHYPSLVKTLKDVRNRYDALKPLSTWALEYLAFYSIMNTPNHKPLGLAPAFKRFFELIASGVFLPNGCILVDPIGPKLRIGFDLELEEMDLVCCCSQTIFRILCTGIQGFRAVLGTNNDMNDLTKEVTTWNGVTISPLELAFTTNCMDAEYENEPTEGSTA